MRHPVIYWKKLLENKEMFFENGVKSIQAAAYNGARTVSKIMLHNRSQIMYLDLIVFLAAMLSIPLLYVHNTLVKIASNNLL
jgi:hypothetical protein